jgi:hypothetical protein
MSKAEYEEILARVKGRKAKDKATKYKDLYNRAKPAELTSRTARILKKVSFRLPCRLSSPIVIMPIEVKEYIESGAPSEFTGLNQFTLDALYNLYHKLISEGILTTESKIKVELNIDSVLNIAEAISQQVSTNVSHEYIKEQETISKISNWMTDLDIKQACMRDELYFQKEIIADPVSPFLQMFYKIRARATQQLSQSKVSGANYYSSDPSFNYLMTKDGYIIIRSNDCKNDWIIVMADRYVAMYSKQLLYWTFCGMPYLDYIVTREEILLNMSIIKKSKEYNDMEELFDFFKVLLGQTEYHSICVDFMKNYEGFLNMTADFKADKRCSATSYSEVIKNMNILSKSISHTDITVDEVLEILFSSSNPEKWNTLKKCKKNVMALLANSIKNLTSIRLLEASSLHKLCFYAVIDEDKGLTKYCGRTFTERKVSLDDIKQLRSIFNREYIQSYYRRHKRLPQILRTELDIALIESKIRELNLQIKLTGDILIIDKSLEWWYNLRPYNTEECTLTGDPVEQAKDKRSAKDEGSYSPMDTEKELEYIIKQKKIDYIPLLDSIVPKCRPQTVRKIMQGSEPYKEMLTTVLKEKEREQKIEGRLFGMFTTKGKQTVSKFMRKSEHILSYFKGNLMTPSDKERKMILHWMAQSLLDEDKYAILSDIEAHNQSMQIKNTYDLIESIGLCFGEKDWGKLSYLFNNLNIYYCKTYVDESVIFTGQYGGIEGWYNPIWTLHTLLVSKLISEMTELDICNIAVYSDDIAMVVSHPMVDNQAQNRVLKVIQDHYAKFGMILKASQTVVSKYRITMLRQHYIMGIRADSSLKRMVSASSMGSSLYHCDEIEASGLTSAVSSSIELANSIKTQTFLKWYRCIQLLYRGFISGLTTKIDPNIMNENFFSEGTISLYKSYFDYEQIHSEGWIINRIISEMDDIEREACSGWLQTIVKDLSQKKLSGSELDTMTDQIRRIIYEDEAFWVLLYFKCVLPNDLGGAGVIPLEIMALTGVRDNLGRLLGNIISTFRSHKRWNNLSLRILENALGGKFLRSKLTLDIMHNPDNVIKVSQNNADEYYTTSYDETVLINQEWPNAQRVIPPMEMIKTKLLEWFKKNCVNESLKQLLDMESSKSEFKQELINLNREKFTNKVTRFYYDTSAFTIIDKILGKVENTSSIITKCSRFDKLCNKLASIGVYAMRKWLHTPMFTFGELDEQVIVHEYLHRRKVIMFPNIEFLPLIEPEVNSVIIYNDPATPIVGITDWTHHLVMASSMTHSMGKLRYLPPTYGSEALYKGAVRDENEAFSHLREALMIKCISVTKWMIYRSDPSEYHNNILISTNISNMADLSLATLGYNRFQEYQHYVSLLARSEIAHRIPILDSKTKSVCRILPSKSPQYKVVLNQSYISRMNLIDSNIHFDYFKLRLILAEAICSSVKEPPRFNATYKMKESDLIRDVQFNYIVEKEIVNVSKFKFHHHLTIHGISLGRIRWLSDNIVDITEGQFSPIVPNFAILEDNQCKNEDILETLICDFYRRLKRENMWELNPIWSDEPWQPFLNKYKHMFPKDMYSNIEYIRNILVDHTNRQLSELKKKSGITTEELLTRELISRLKESGHMGIKDNEELIADMQDLLSFIGRVHLDTESKEKSIGEALNLIKSNKLEILKAVYQEIILDKCLILQVDKKSVFVLLNQSMYMVEELLTDINIYLTGDRKSEILMMLVSKEISGAELLRISHSLFIECQELIDNDTLELSISELINIKSDGIYNNDISVPHPIETINLVVSPFNITELSEIELSSYRSMLSFRSALTRQFSSPDINSGPYGSDCYQTAYNIFKYLRELNIVDENTTVFDVCAGRGECAYALDKLGIKRTSYNRVDTYSMIKHHIDIEYIPDYDLSGENLPDRIIVDLYTNCSESDMILIDVSHMGKRTQEFKNRIFDIIATKVQILIRYSAISSCLNEILEYSRSLRVSVYLLLTGKKGMTGPTNYILITEDKFSIDTLPSMIESNNITTYIRKSCKFLLSDGHRNLCNSGSMYNSVIDDLGGRGEFERHIGDKLRAISNSLRNKYMSNVITQLNRLDKCIIYGKLCQSLVDIGFEVNKEFHHVEIDILEWHKNKSIILTNQEMEKYKDIDKEKRIYELDINQCTIESMLILRKYHPSRSYRSLFHALFTLQIGYEPDKPVSIKDQILTLWDNPTIPSRRSNIRTQNLMDALGLLAFDCICNRSILHQRIIHMAVRSKVIDSKAAKDILYYRRMMSGLYNIVYKFVTSWSVDVELIQGLRRYIFDKYCNPSIYSSEARYTISTENIKGKIIDKDKLMTEEESDKLFRENISSLMDLDMFTDKLIIDNSNLIKSTDKGEAIKNVDKLATYSSGAGDLFSGIELNLSDKTIAEHKRMKEQIAADLRKDKNLTAEVIESRSEMFAIYQEMFGGDDYDEDTEW